MSIEEMHFQLRLEYNKIASNHKKSFSDAEMDAILNNAIQEYKEIFYSGNNSKRIKLGFEVTQQRIDMLSTLVVGFPEQGPIAPATNSNNVYEFKFSSLIHPYAHHLRTYITVSECNGINLSVNIEQSGDMNAVLDDANSRPSLLWRRSIGRIRKTSDSSKESSLYVYTGGEFTPTEAYVEYLKQPAKVCLGTYTDIPTLDNPTPSLKPQVHCDLPEDYHHLVVTIAAAEISRILEDVNRLQVRTDRFNNIS